MAQTDIFNYGEGKRDIGHSKYDFSFTNIRTQNFGQLIPVGVYETLPDDFWNIGSDGVTLLKPLAAPAFTSIKQHFYAFYTRNQQVWKHWNNYITNGTQMNQVYGSNVSNQNVESPWKVPYINACYLQQICKIAHGFALSFSRFTFNVNTGADGLFSFVSYSVRNVNVSVSYDVTDLVLLGMTFLSNYSSNLLGVVKKFYDFLLRCADKYFVIFLFQGGNLHVLYDFPVNEKLTFESFINDSPSIGRYVVTDTFGEDVDPYSSIPSTSIDYEYITFLKDDFASECDLKRSPFVVTQSYYYDPVNSRSLKTFSRVKRSLGRVVNTLSKKYSETGVGTASVEIYDNIMSEVVESNYFGARYSFEGRFYHDVDASDHVAGVFAMPSYVYKRDFNLSSSFYWEYQLSSDDESVSFSGPWKWTEVIKASDDLLNLVPTYLGGSTSFGLYPFLDGYIGYTVAQNEYPRLSVASLHTVGFVSDPYCNENGYDSLGWLFYLCKNSAQLLDNMDVKDIALATRSFTFYAYERYNALPFMCYSHIWEDHFRNRAVSSPELDFSGVNGSILENTVLLDHLSSVKGNFDKLPTYAEDHDFSLDSPNSWSLNFDSMPRNGIASNYVELGSVRQFFDGTRHYFNITSYQDVFALLTGYALSYVVLLKLYYQDGSNVLSESVSYSFFSELFTKNFYLPNYYNGLLHCKYQNFNKDYFTAGMLDPMSGANDLSLGDTISELRVSEIKQHWYEKIAQNRTIRKFMQRIFGITPIEEPKESRLLGVDHVPIKIGEVIQTSQTTDTSVQGQRTGLGGARGGHGLVHDRCNEHGFIIILSSFTVESQYQQGTDRRFDVKDSYMDYPTVDFAHIGNESIMMKELNFDGPSVGGYPFYVNYYLNDLHVTNDGVEPVNTQSSSFNPHRVVDLSVSGSNATPTLVNNVVAQSGTGLYNVFSYIPRYSSYKFKLDEVHGEFRSELEFWHTFRKFHTMPMLSHSFVNWELLADDNDFNRLFAVSKDSLDAKFCCQTFFTGSVSRALPYVCVPKSTI